MFDDARKRWWALYVLCSGVLMIVLDTTIVNVALPSIREDLEFTETSLVWVVNAYMLTFGGFLLLGGRLGDLFGHRRMFLLGLILFTVGVGRLRPRALAGHADRRARRAGPRRRGRHRGRAVAHHGPVHRERRPRQGHGHLRLRLLGGRQHRRAARRIPHHHAQLALDLPGQRADRRAGVCVLPAPAAARAGNARAARKLDVAGAVTVTRVAHARGVRHRQRPRGRLDVGADAGHARRGAWRCWSPSSSSNRACAIR